MEKGDNMKSRIIKLIGFYSLLALIGASLVVTIGPFALDNKNEAGETKRTDPPVPQNIQYYCEANKSGDGVTFWFNHPLWRVAHSNDREKNAGKLGNDMIASLKVLSGITSVQIEPYGLNISCGFSDQVKDLETQVVSALKKSSRVQVSKYSTWEEDGPKPWELPVNKVPGEHSYFVTYKPKINDHIITINFDEEVGGEIKAIWNDGEVEGKLSKSEYQKLFDEILTIPGVIGANTYKEFLHISLTKATPLPEVWNKIEKSINTNLPGRSRLTGKVLIH